MPIWPNILSDLLRVFDDVSDAAINDDQHRLSILLAACKLLDLLLVLQTEDFQIHQWMFVTDTVDAVYPPVGWTPESLVDVLAESLGSHLVTTAPHSAEKITSESSRRAARRPMLAESQRIQSIAELGPFLTNASITSFENTYQNLPVDWDYLDSTLENEIFTTIESTREG